MKRKFLWASCLAIGFCACAWAADWPSTGGNPQRDGWSQGETVISKESIAAKNFEVVIEGRHLEHLGHRKVALLCERDEMAIVQSAVSVVEAMQVLDQEITPMRAVADQRADFLDRNVVGLTALELALSA